MSEPLSIAASITSLATAIVVAAPKVSRWWAAHRKADASVETARVHAHEREDSRSFDIADRLIKARERDHDYCRQEVAALRLEVGAAREAVEECQKKHNAAEERIDAQDAQIVDLRDMLAWMKSQLDRIERRSNPPEGAPAE